MFSEKVIRWWPLVGLVAMVVLGLAVGPASTGLDDWFVRTGDEHQNLGLMLLFTDPRLLLLIFGVSVAVAVHRRRWRLASVLVVAPVVAVAAARICKTLFGREKFGGLAYPSGHVTVTVMVAGMAVLVAGSAAWAVVGAVMLVVLGVLGQAFTYHYFTDTIGAILLGTALLGVAARAAQLDRCQPRCDLHHNGG